MFKAINKKFHTPTWLFILLLIVLILRIPSLLEPYSYGDEMIYLALGEAIRQGIPLYKGIHDNKPPLLYLTAAIAGNLFLFRALLAVWHLITVYIFWKLSELLFPKNDKLQKISTSIFAIFTTIPFLEGNIANAELFMAGPTILAFIVLLKKNLNLRKVFLAGALFSISTLYKIPSAFDIPAIVFLWIVTEKISIKNIIDVTKRTLILSAGFIIPIIATLVWYYFQGAFGEYLVAAFGQNVGYLSSFRPADTERSFIERNLPLLQRGTILLLGALILFWKRKKLSKEFIFATIWLLLTIFAVTLSERPYPHYLIQSVAPASLLFGMLFTLKTMEQSLTIIPLSVLFFAPVYYKFWYYPTAPYYVRFVRFASGNISKEKYLASFGNHIPRNYKIAEYLSSNSKPHDKIFVQGDSSMIYALSKRLPPIKYVADYHIKDFSSNKKTVESLILNMPKFIVVLPNSSESKELINFIENNYGIVENIDGAVIWKLLNPKLRTLLSY